MFMTTLSSWQGCRNMLYCRKFEPGGEAVEQKTKERGTWILVGVVWGGVAVVVTVLIILLVSFFRGLQPQPEAETTAAPVETQAPTAVTTLPPEPEFYLPQLDLPENPYGVEDFEYHGRYLTCTAGESVLGIDVSFWQGDINWKLVKAAGVEFAMIRLARRGGDEGILEEDSFVHANYEGAKDAGVQVGGYFFSQAITPEEAVEEAEFVLELIKDWKFEMPIVYDWEQAGGTRTVNMDPRTLTECAKAFCQTIEDAGYDAMVYFNRNMAYYEIYLEELTQYDFWLAMYESPMDFPYKIDMWQYTSAGSVPGINGNVDLNLYFIYDE